jgi:hypothetical protein
MEQELKSLQQEAINDINSASNLNALNDVRVKYLGKKGSLTSILRGIGLYYLYCIEFYLEYYTFVLWLGFIHGILYCM